MADALERIDPRPDWPTVHNPFGSAGQAFDAGNYPLALEMAAPDSELRACAMIMGGALALGLPALQKFESPRARLVRAYAHWCLNQSDEARSLLREIERTDLGPAAQKFLDFLDRPVDVAVIAMPGDARRQPFDGVAGIQVHWVQLDVHGFGTTMRDALANAMPAGVKADLVISLDAYGPYLPVDPTAPGIPLAFWAGDHDYFFATRYADLARADLIVANSASEQVELARHYGARCVAFPGYETYRQGKTTSADTPREIDIFFSGRAFVPYMRDKAQYLFHIATQDSAHLKIDIVDGYLSDADYQAALTRAKYVPIYWRSAGGLQTRAIEALRAGASILSPERAIARPLLGDAAALYRCAIDADIPAILDDHRPSGRAVARDIDDLFWTSPSREERLLKFCLFQTIFLETRKETPPPPNYHPVELRGYEVAGGLEVYTRLARLNGAVEAPDATNYLHAAAAAFYAAVLLSNNPNAGQSVAQMALDFYRTGIDAHPQSLALRFNGARALWTFGRRDEALNGFRTIVEQLPDLAFDARTDPLLSHRIRILADMFPYGDFFRAAVDPQPGPHQGRARAPGAREFIASSALSYIACDLIDRNEAAASIGILERSIERCSVNVAAWRLLVQARSRTHASPASIREAFYRLVNLYPPELFDLLPIGLEAELAEERRAEATDLLRKWVLARSRVHDAAGNPPVASDATLTAARRHRHLLSDWTQALFDRIVGAD